MRVKVDGTPYRPVHLCTHLYKCYFQNEEGCHVYLKSLQVSPLITMNN